MTTELPPLSRAGLRVGGREGGLRADGLAGATCLAAMVGVAVVFPAADVVGPVFFLLAGVLLTAGACLAALFLAVDFALAGVALAGVALAGVALAGVARAGAALARSFALARDRGDERARAIATDAIMPRRARTRSGAP
ncbi:MAG TPA: hypothetical protein VF516_33655 [Kofleriaceae bacterium]